MVLGRSTGMTTHDRCGLDQRDGSLIQFFNAAPKQPDKYSSGPDTLGYQTYCSIHLSEGSTTPAGSENFSVTRRPGDPPDTAIGTTANFTTTDTVTNDWYVFDDSIGNNLGYGSVLDYSSTPYPEHMSIVFNYAISTMLVNAINTEDVLDKSVSDASFPKYTLTSRSNWTRYKPNKPCSARFMKKLFAGNINRITAYSRQILSTALEN